MVLTLGERNYFFMIMMALTWCMPNFLTSTHAHKIGNVLYRRSDYQDKNKSLEQRRFGADLFCKKALTKILSPRQSIFTLLVLHPHG